MEAAMRNACRGSYACHKYWMPTGAGWVRTANFQLERNLNVISVVMHKWQSLHCWQLAIAAELDTHRRLHTHIHTHWVALHITLYPSLDCLTWLAVVAVHHHCCLAAWLLSLFLHSPLLPRYQQCWCHHWRWFSRIPSHAPGLAWCNSKASAEQAADVNSKHKLSFRLSATAEMCMVMQEYAIAKQWWLV